MSPRPPVSAPVNDIEKKTVEYAQFDNELNLEAGDMVDLLRHIDHEWLEGNTIQHNIHQNTNMQGDLNRRRGRWFRYTLGFWTDEELVFA